MAIELERLEDGRGRITEPALPLDDIERINRAAYDKAAPRLIGFEEELPVPEDDLTLFLERMSGPRMLDIGCGWGRYVHRFTEAGLEYLGIDFSSGMLAGARRMNPCRSFLKMSYNQLGFRDASFDGIWACCAFGMEPKRQTPAALAELRRVLKPGGIVTFVLHYTGWGDDGLDEGDELYGPKYCAVWEPSEFEQVLVQGGFAEGERILRPECGSMTFIVKK
jgi:SAM-dependent methyltransferase